MTTPLHVPRSASADLIGFACGHCGTLLEVPATLAGVNGPCPVCGGEISAPVWTAELPAPPTQHVAHALAKPPPVRDLPPPLAPVDSLLTLPLPVRPEPIAELPVMSRAPSANGSVPQVNGHAAPTKARSTRPAPLFPAKERGIFDGSADSREHRLDIHRSPGAFRCRGWRRWLDIGIVGVFTGLLIAVIVTLRFTVPIEAHSVPGLPANLTELVALETKNLKLREMEAAELARAAVNRYLGAASEQAAVSHLLPPPDGISSPPFPPFAGPMSGAFAVQSSRRIAGTDRFLVVVGPEGQRGPTFVVEQTESGPRLHAGAITQQSAGLFEKFIATPGEGEATLYAKVKPTTPVTERGYRAQRPDLAGFRFVDVSSAFPLTGLDSVIGCIKPGSDAAKCFSRRAHDVGWRSALVHLRWQRHREAGPYVELVNFVPGTWSGERVLSPPAATVATKP